MKFRSAFAVLSMTVALAACSELPFQTAAKPEATGHVGPPGVSPLEQPIETGAELVPVATATPPLPIQLSALSQHRRLKDPKVQLFTDYMAAQIRDDLRRT